MRKPWSVLVAVLLAAGVSLQCANQKIPAEAAVSAADNAFQAVRAEAEKYVPDQVTPVQDSIDAAKASIAKGDYEAALNSAKALPSQISALGTAAAAKKAEFAASWGSLSAGLPKVVEAIQSRIDILSKSKKLPAGLTKEKFEAAKSGLGSITQTWADATAAFQAGSMKDAVAKAQVVKAKAMETLQDLNMPVPAGLQ
jgi:hypothetical protein